MRKFLLCCLLALLAVAQGYSQTKTVSGKVTDKSGSPLEGVTVAVVETQKATVTDKNGNFAIAAAAGNNLRFTYVGASPYTYTVYASTSKISIQLDLGNTSLNEVVVTGYTAERKKDLTGSVAVVNLKDIKDIPAGNAMKALQGRVPGVQITGDGSPNGAVTVRIRGIGTLGNNDPLYVIDGMPSQRGLQEINQNDIESIQVLKDAASATIYGSRAANGVIIVTTKRGRNGVNRVDVDASASLQYYTSKIKTLNTEQRGQAYWQAAVNDKADPNNNGLYTYDWNQDYNNPELNKVVIPEYIDAAKTMKAANTNWFDEISQPSILQYYNVTVSNGSDKGTSLFSLGYYDNKGIIKSSESNKITLRANTDYNFFGGRLKVGENLNGTYMKDVILPTGDITILSIIEQPIVPVYTINGGWGGPSAGMDDRQNPYRLIEDNKQNHNNFARVLGNVYAELGIASGLRFRTNFGVDYAGNYIRNLQKSYVSGFLTQPDNTLRTSADYAGNIVWQNTLTYDQTFGKHKVNALLGHEQIKFINQNFYGQAQGLALENMNYAYLDAASKNVLAGGNGGGSALLSYFARANYIYNDRYLISGTIRRDGSSQFGSENQYGIFPAGAVSWRISQEPFMKNVKAVSDLKLRYSLGQTGNQAIPNYATNTLYAAVYGTDGTQDADNGTAYDINGQNTGQLPSGFARTQNGNNAIKWETTTMSNFGVDYGLFNNMLTGSFDYFIRKTKDILISPPYIAVLGEGGTEVFNGASMSNKGFDAILTYNGKINNDLTLNITGNVSAYRDKITSLPPEVLTGYPGNGTTETVLGRSVSSEFGYVADGIFKTQSEVDNSPAQPGKALGRIRYKDLNGDNTIDDKDRMFLGKSNPDFTYGLNTVISYKNFDFSFFFQGLTGNTVYNNYKYLTDFSSLAPGSNWGTRTLKAWSPTNTGSNIPALTLVDRNNEGRYSSYFLESGAYLKLRNAQISYNLHNVLKSLKVRNARVYIQGSNIWTIKSKSFTAPDPENPGNLYPIPAVTTIGLSLSL